VYIIGFDFASLDDRFFLLLYGTIFLNYH